MVLTDGDPLSTIDYLSPLGKSDHSVLSITCRPNISISNKMFVEQFNYSKGDTTTYVTIALYNKTTVLSSTCMKFLLMTPKTLYALLIFPLYVLQNLI